MIMYHGSYKAVEKPDLAFSRLRTDFGKGFYLTPIKSQALIDGFLNFVGFEVVQ